MIEWAVLRAIFLPAADVAEGCFLFELGDVDFELWPWLDAVGDVCASSFGFICMIFLARLGGGGKSSLFLTLPDNVLLRCSVGEVGGDLWLIAAGGRANALSISVSFSCAVGPVDVLGVGGYFPRGMIHELASSELVE